MFERFPFRSDPVDDLPILEASALDENRAHVGRFSESDAALATTEPAVAATALAVPPGTVEIHRRGASHVQTRHANRGSGRTATFDRPDAATITTVSSVIRSEGIAALVGLGWTPAIAGAAIDGACAALTAPTLEALIREALRRCPRPLARMP